MEVFGKRDKVVPLDMFPNLFWAENCFTEKFEIEDDIININVRIWGCILVLYFGYPYFRWKFNYKYGTTGFYCRISSMTMDEFM